MAHQVAFVLLLPVYLGQRLTIPFASGAGYRRDWLIVSLLCCPLALVWYAGCQSLPAVLSAAVAGVAAAAVGAVLTARDQPGDMAAVGYGTKVAGAVPGVLAVLAFVMGAVWVDTLASEVVAIVSFLGNLAGLPAGVAGLTLLAWGNSLSDFFGNRAMARAGHASTAITACFAAPLFNMLLSLALGFGAVLAKLKGASVPVQLTPDVAVGCGMLIVHGVVLMAVGRRRGVGRLPPWFANFSRVWYAIYLGLALTLGMSERT